MTMWRDDKVAGVMEQRIHSGAARKKKTEKSFSSLTATVEKELIAIDLQHLAISYSKSSGKSWRTAKGNVETQM